MRSLLTHEDYQERYSRFSRLHFRYVAVVFHQSTYARLSLASPLTAPTPNQPCQANTLSCRPAQLAAAATHFGHFTGAARLPSAAAH
jgi:hypothetical protein